MPLAQFLGPMQAMAPAAVHATAGRPLLGAAPPPPAQMLPGFSVQHQQQANWCWAALSASVAAFYGATNWQQCTVAAAELAPLDCCGSDGPLGCNRPWYLSSALTRVGHYNGLMTPNASFAMVQGEIGAGHPLGCRIAWNGGGAHFMAIGGWLTAADGTQYVDIYDPIYGFSQLTYSSFCSSYHQPGDTWTHTYLTH